MQIVRFFHIALIVFCLTTLPQTLVAQQEAEQQSQVDLGAFVKEIFKLRLDDNLSELAIWIPFEFYVEASLTDGGKTRQAVEKELEYLKPYTTMMVQCSIEQPDGTALYSSEEDVRKRAVLKLPDGTEIGPLASVPPLVAATVAATKTMLSAEGDPGGANMHVLVFPNKNKQGQPIVDASKKDKLTLMLKADVPFDKTVFTWHTPFDATMVVPPCAKCGETVSASWSFCPWCGAALSK